MADEIELHYVDDQPPEAAIQQWRAGPPAPLRGWQVVDESYNSLTYESRFYDWPQKLMFIATLGFAWLLRNILSMQSIWKVTVRFDAEGDSAHRTKVTIFGHAEEKVRGELAEVAAEHGGAVDLRVGV